ncbi:FAD/NAD-P-binding domain-containing protein [Amylostereum chailletii]|nr:FAD/NAD-P-binding domain-containing protein [Amylostereum chailletii]
MQNEQQPLLYPGHDQRKRIAIVGGGTGGVTTLKTLLVDIPAELRQHWEVVLYEQRAGLGGVWLADTYKSISQGTDDLPETPLYPGLVTNTPHPTMTIPHFTFQPETPLFPGCASVQQYHDDVVNHWNLSSHIRLNHTVTNTRWHGTESTGHWIVTVEARHGAEQQASHGEFDHLIIANGHNHYPYEPTFEGRQEWLDAAPNRTFVHSIFFRGPEDFKGKNVLVVGGGASGQDIAHHVVGSANSTTLSLKRTDYRGIPSLPPIPGVSYKSRIARLTTSAIEFDDNTTLTHIDTVILATGYENQIPFLTQGGHLDIVPTTTNSSRTLTNNLRYIRPLYNHLLSLDPSYPQGALYFIGLPIFVANAFSDHAQALFTGHTIANPSLLPSRAALLDELNQDETHLRDAGYDPGYIGHRLILGEQAGVKYQDGLVRFLQERGLAGNPGIPDVQQNYTEEWRRFGRDQALLLKQGWKRVEGYGEETAKAWLKGVKTEEQWAQFMKRLSEWERKQKDDGI